MANPKRTGAYAGVVITDDAGQQHYSERGWFAHSPAPWRAVPNGNGVRIESPHAKASGTEVAQVRDAEDAQLVTAAPDLYAAGRAAYGALSSAIETASTCGDPDCKRCAWFNRTLNALGEALAKAEGWGESSQAN